MPIQDKYESVQKTLGVVSDVLGAKGEQRFADPTSEIPDFTNGEDLNQPTGAVEASTAPIEGGSTVITLSKKIELIHFGRVYLDSSAKWRHGDLDDVETSDLGAELGARAIMFRAALQREAILLGGFISAAMDSISEKRDAMNGGPLFPGDVGLASVAEVIGNLFGGGTGTKNGPDAAVLNPFVDKVIEIGGKLNAVTIDYATLHQAGIDLHQTRMSFRKFLKDEIARSHDPPNDPGLLSQLPGIGPLVPGEIGRLFTVAFGLGFKVFEVYYRLILELSLRMQPSIEAACRQISIDAIKRKKTPIYPLWRKRPTIKKSTVTGKLVPKKTGVAMIDAVIDDFNAGLGTKIEEVVDFLSNPGAPQPGSPYLDQAFQLPRVGPKDGEAPHRAELLGQVTVNAFEAAIGADLPELVEKLAGTIMMVNAEFLRGVYKKLLTLPPDVPIEKASLVEAAKIHLVSQVVDTLVASVGLVDLLPQKTLKAMGRTLVSVDALIMRCKELLGEHLDPFISPIIEHATGDLADLLERARKASKDAPTMEAYLALLPVAIARMFRNTFFPVWDLLVHTVFHAVTKAITPLAGELGEKAGKAKELVDDVRTGLHKANELRKVAEKKFGDGVQLSDFKDLAPFKAAFGAELDEEETVVIDARSQRFPCENRRTQGRAPAIAAETYDLVAPNLKWKKPEALPAPTEGGKAPEGGGQQKPEALPAAV